jgi:hypothetical protein
MSFINKSVTLHSFLKACNNHALSSYIAAALSCTSHLYKICETMIRRVDFNIFFTCRMINKTPPLSCGLLLYKICETMIRRVDSNIFFTCRIRAHHFEVDQIFTSNNGSAFQILFTMKDCYEKRQNPRE